MTPILTSVTLKIRSRSNLTPFSNKGYHYYGGLFTHLYVKICIVKMLLGIFFKIYVVLLRFLGFFKYTNLPSVKMALITGKSTKFNFFADYESELNYASYKSRGSRFWNITPKNVLYPAPLLSGQFLAKFEHFLTL